MENATRAYYDKRGEVLVKNLRRRHFDAYYCADRAAALSKVLELIPEGSTVGWGGATSASQVGVQAALNAGNYQTIDRDPVSDPAEKLRCMRECSTPISSSPVPTPSAWTARWSISTATATGWA